MPDNPHSYVLERAHGGPEFDAFIAAVKVHGTTRLYQGNRYKTITIGEFVYWLHWARGAGRVINRKRAVEAGWDDELQLQLGNGR